MKKLTVKNLSYASCYCVSYGQVSQVGNFLHIMNSCLNVFYVLKTGNMCVEVNVKIWYVQTCEWLEIVIIAKALYLMIMKSVNNIDFNLFRCIIIANRFCTVRSKWWKPLCCETWLFHLILCSMANKNIESRSIAILIFQFSYYFIQRKGCASLHV